MTRRQALRILDANFNRCREGLRVCEELARFVLEDETATRDLKRARHAVSRCLKRTGASLSELLAARDTRSDVGRRPEPAAGRRSALDLFAANIERAKEALRALEETAKFLAVRSLARTLKKIRFDVYAIEKQIIPRLEALRHHRPRLARRA